MAIAALDGVWVGYTANLYKRMEDSALVGVNRFLTAASQVDLFSIPYILLNWQ